MTHPRLGARPKTGNRLLAAVEQTTEDRGVHFRWLPDGPAHRLPPSSPRTPVRFSVGEPGKRSSVWRLWGTKKTNDLYLASRASAGIFKYSFHESGDWRLQLIARDHRDGPAFAYHGLKDGRLLDRWSRPASRGGWTEMLSIWVPWSDLIAIPNDPEPGVDAQWMTAPKKHHAVEFRLFLIDRDAGAYEFTNALSNGSTFALVNGFVLPNRETCVVTACTQPMTSKLRQSMRAARARSLTQVDGSNFDRSAEKGPRTAILSVDEDGHRSLWDLRAVP